MDRAAFDRYVKNQPDKTPIAAETEENLNLEAQPSEPTPQNTELANHILENLVPELDKRHKWMGDIEPELLARLLDDIDYVRLAYAYEHDKPAKDHHVYHHYRMQYDQSAGDSSDRAGAYQALMVIDALMDGDIKNGRLPRFSDLE